MTPAESLNVIINVTANVPLIDADADHIDLAIERVGQRIAGSDVITNDEYVQYINQLVHVLKSVPKVREVRRLTRQAIETLVSVIQTAPATLITEEDLEDASLRS